MSRPSTRPIPSKTLPETSDTSDDEPQDKPNLIKELVKQKITDIATRLNKTKEIPTKDRKRIIEDLTDIQSAVNNLLALTSPKQTPLNTILNKILENVLETSTQVKTLAQKQASSQSYASAAKLPKIHGKQIPQKGITPPQTNKITIYPAQDNAVIKTSEDTKAALTKAINPQKQNFHPDKLIRIPNRGICIESRSLNIQNLLSVPELKKAGLVATTHSKFNPRLAIDNVPKHLVENDIPEAMQELSKSEGDIKIISKFGRRDAPTNNWVVETSPEVRALAIKAGRIYAGWSACRVEDHVRVVRCFNCQKLGHQSDKCQSKTTCGHCSEDHKTEECPKIDSTPSCANCTRSSTKNNNSDHQAWSKKCPAYLRRLEAHIGNINYGQDAN